MAYLNAQIVTSKQHNGNTDKCLATQPVSILFKKEVEMGYPINSYVAGFLFIIYCKVRSGVTLKNVNFQILFYAFL